jgi:hypothetical protein
MKIDDIREDLSLIKPAVLKRAPPALFFASFPPLYML